MVISLYGNTSISQATMSSGIYQYTMYNNISKCRWNGSKGCKTVSICNVSNYLKAYCPVHSFWYITSDKACKWALEALLVCVDEGVKWMLYYRGLRGCSFYT